MKGGITFHALKSRLAELDRKEIELRMRRLGLRYPKPSAARVEKLVMDYIEYEVRKEDAYFEKGCSKAHQTVVESSPPIPELPALRLYIEEKPWNTKGFVARAMQRRKRGLCRAANRKSIRSMVISLRKCSTRSGLTIGRLVS